MNQGRIFGVGFVKLVCTACFITIYSTTVSALPIGASISGELAVGADGAANYSIGLITPPGIIKPSLSINYSSQAGNGTLGVGWSVGGLSQIIRCPRTKEIDGVEDGIVGLVASDRLCLDGQRLILKKGSVYGASGAEYSTQIESFTKIVGYGEFGSASSWFKVWRKNGEILELGNTADSRASVTPIGLAAIPYTWSVNKVSDRYSNYYTVSYLQDSGVNYPKTIKFSGNETNGSLPAREVMLNWGQTTTRPDPISLYIGGGGRASIRYRLESINNNANNASYKLGYKISQANESSIEKLQYCPDGAESNCLTVETKYGNEKSLSDSKRISDPQLVLSQFGTAQGWVDFNVNPRTLADVNGDGRLDIVGFANDGVYVALGSDNGFNPAIKKLDAYGVSAGGWTDSKKFPRIVTDINGDGLADIVGFAANGVTVSLSTGDGFLQPTIWVSAFGTAAGWTDQGAYHREMADANGDGLLDVVGITPSGQVYVSINNKNSFSPPVLNATLWAFADLNGGSGTVALNEKQTPIQIADVNSDGKADIAIWLGFMTGTLIPRISYGSSHGFGDFKTTSNDYSALDPNAPVPGYNNIFTRTDMTWDSTAVSLRKLTDVNGDGLLDIVGITTGTYFDTPCWFNCTKPYLNKHYRKNSVDVWIAYNLGNNLFSIEKKVRDGGGYIVDENYEYYSSLILSAYDLSNLGGDVKDDLINYTGTCASIAVSMKDSFSAEECLVNGFTPQNGSWDAQKHQRVAADINGDGAPDVLGFGASGVYVAYSNAKYPQKIISIKDDLSDSVISYGSLVDSKVYQKGAGAEFPIAEVQTPMQVVTSLSVSNGLGGVSRKYYRYGGLRSDVNRGLLGFKWTEVMDPQSGSLSFTEFKQSFPYIGAVSKSQAQRCLSVSVIPWSNCEVLTQEVSDWSYRTLGDTPESKVFMPFVMSTQESSWTRISQ